MTIVDQAATLRHLMAARGAPSAIRSPRSTRVIAVASGKGGVGKTNLTVNLAIALAREGKKVVVLDGDLGLANVDVICGLITRATLHDVIVGAKRLSEVLVAAPGGIWVVPGASGLEEMANLSDERRRYLVDALADLDGRADVLLIDTAAGVSSEVSTLLAAAPEILVVTTPEPTAITDAYALIKVAARTESAEHTSATTRFRLIVNQANSVGEATEVAKKIDRVAREFLDVSLEMLGYVPVDPYVGRSVRRQVPLLVGYPSSTASLRIVELARRLALGPSPAKESRSSIMSFLERLAVPRASLSARAGVR